MKATIVFRKNWTAMHARNPDGSRRYRYIVNKGSSRSSKTTSLIDCYDLYARELSDKRLTVWRDTKTDCKKTVLVDAIKHLRRTGRYRVGSDFNKTESIFTYNNNSTFEIHGTDDEETVHGLSQDVAWLNEPYKIGKDTFDQIDQRTADMIFIDWNPKKSHWIDNLLKDPRTLEIHSTFRDNPFCPPEERRKILSYQPIKRCALVESKALTEQEARGYDCITNVLCFPAGRLRELIRCRENEDKSTADDFKWSVYGLGEKGEVPHRIFKWKEIPYEQYRALDLPRYYGCDWGAVDPWGILESKYQDGNLYLHELNYRCENDIRANLTTTERMQIDSQEEGIVSWLFAKLGIDKRSVLVCDDNRPMKIAAARRGGWPYAYPATKGKDSILDGIDLLNNLVNVYYTSTSVNLKYEQENYSREVDKYGVVQEVPEDLNNHLIDPSRYIAQYLRSKSIIRRL